MRKILFTIITGLTILTLSACATSAPTPTPTPTPPPVSPIPPTTSSETKTYQSSTYNYEVTYPSSMTLYQGPKDSAAMNTVSYIPMCDPNMVDVCIVLTNGAYPNTNFESAGVSIKKPEQMASEADCKATLADDVTKTQQTTINGHTFFSQQTGEGAAGHTIEGTEYVAFQNGKCYTLTALIASSRFENFDPSTGIKEFSAANRTAVENKLTEVVKSFRFTK